MENNIDYSKFNNIKIEELNFFFDFSTDTVYKYLKMNNISTLKDLFEAYDNNLINLGNAKNKTKNRLLGIVELLKYKYLDVSLNYDYYYDIQINPYISHYTDIIRSTSGNRIELSRMGFDGFEITVICSVLRKTFKDIKLIDLMYLVKKECEERKLLTKSGRYILLYEAIITKIDILIDYYMKSNSKIRMKNLNDEIQKLR